MRAVDRLLAANAHEHTFYHGIAIRPGEDGDRVAFTYKNGSTYRFLKGVRHNVCLNPSARPRNTSCKHQQIGIMSPGDRQKRRWNPPPTTAIPLLLGFSRESNV